MWTLEPQRSVNLTHFSILFQNSLDLPILCRSSFVGCIDWTVIIGQRRIFALGWRNFHFKNDLFLISYTCTSLSFNLAIWCVTCRIRWAKEAFQTIVQGKIVSEQWIFWQNGWESACLMILTFLQNFIKLNMETTRKNPTKLLHA